VSAGGGHGGDHVVQLGLVDIDGDDMCAFAREGLDAGSTHAGRRRRDDGALAL